MSRLCVRMTLISNRPHSFESRSKTANSTDSRSGHSWLAMQADHVLLGFLVHIAALAEVIVAAISGDINIGPLESEIGSFRGSFLGNRTREPHFLDDRHARDEN